MGDHSTVIGWPPWEWCAAIMLGQWVTILMMRGGIPWVGGSASWGWCSTTLGIIGDNYLKIGWPSFGRLLTIFCMVDDHPCDVVWPSWGWCVTIYGSCHLMLFLWVKSNCQILSLQYTSIWWVTILGPVGVHLKDDRWPSMAVVTCYYFCE